MTVYQPVWILNANVGRIVKMSLQVLDGKPQLRLIRPRNSPWTTSPQIHTGRPLSVHETFLALQSMTIWMTTDVAGVRTVKYSLPPGLWAAGCGVANLARVSAGLFVQQRPGDPLGAKGNARVPA